LSADKQTIKVADVLDDHDLLEEALWRLER
jgi:hypothetical protein